MYDAVTVAHCPDGAPLYAAYIDGRYQNVAEMRFRHPAATIVTIATAAAHDAQVLDVETGDANPVQATGWVARQRAAGRTPTVYCNASTWPTCRREFYVMGEPEPQWWIALYDGDPALPAGAVAKQYATGDYDTSSVADFWPGVDGEDDMPLTADDLTKITTIVQEQCDQAIARATAGPSGSLFVLMTRLYNNQFRPWLASIAAKVGAQAPPGD